ncbi:hypothetical protein DFJ43DRAFT_1150085 [Lentinula guzmanii]|uniref:FAD/NAD(P)-binding domain-containing protein n=1 Tax=Lentinula guzmanii TaxID=2804957 RepID=A0AA38JG39_9AGAR|nr:hypothetical protein DFJ43DRAFT_1150085 [Lentinula guzmanii]
MSRVGAGFAGIFELYRLRSRSLGYSTKVFEAEGDIGGVWWRNCYPGARVDSVVTVYEFSDEKVWRDWSWSEIYPGWKELRRYFQHVDEKLHVRKDIVFNRKVVSAKWNADNDRWLVTSQDGFVVSARFFLLCVGNTSKIYITDIPRLDRFRGACHHTARWPQLEEGIDLHGKRVAVIGTGASGVQVIQNVGPCASSLTVYQRTPNIAFPMRQKSIDDDASATMKYDVYSLIFRRLKQTSEIPPHPVGAKRSSLEASYFDTFNLPNVDLIDLAQDPIIEITANGILTADGHERVFDVIIFATGFDAMTGGITQIDIEGTDGIFYLRQMGERYANVLGNDDRQIPQLVFHLWTRRPDRIFEWANVHCEYFTVYFQNLLTTSWTKELQGEWINACIKDTMEKTLTRIEPLLEAEEEWQNEVSESMSSRLLSTPTSVLMGKNIPGKVSEPLSYVGGIPKYIELCRKKMENGFEGFS